MTDERPDDIQFLLNIPTDRVDDIAQAMSQAGIHFSPTDDMVAIDLDVETVVMGVNQGIDLPDLIDTMNIMLTLHGERPLISTDHQQWSYRQRYAVLQLVTTQLSGLATVHAAPWWIAQARQWHPDVTAMHPDVPWATA